MSVLIAPTTDGFDKEHGGNADTLRKRHDAMVAALTCLEAPPSPSIYDRRDDKAWWLEDEVRYLRAVVSALAPVFDLAAADAADHAGARTEDFAIVEAAAEDFIAPLVTVAEMLIEGRQDRGRGGAQPALPPRS